MHRRIPLTCHCEEAQPTWQSRSTRSDRRKAIGESATASPRFPRRFAPRNDKLGSIARSAKPLYNLPACKALTTRKGHAASVRRQSRQRLRSERRYRRNWLVRFYRYLVRTGSAFPRLPRRLRLLAMNKSGAVAVLTMARSEGQCLPEIAPPTAPVLRFVIARPRRGRGNLAVLSWMTRKPRRIRGLLQEIPTSLRSSE